MSMEKDSTVRGKSSTEEARILTTTKKLPRSKKSIEEESDRSIISYDGIFVGKDYQAVLPALDTNISTITKDTLTFHPSSSSLCSGIDSSNFQGLLIKRMEDLGWSQNSIKRIYIDPPLCEWQTWPTKAREEFNNHIRKRKAKKYSDDDLDLNVIVKNMKNKVNMKAAVDYYYRFFGFLYED